MALKLDLHAARVALVCAVASRVLGAQATIAPIVKLGAPVDLTTPEFTKIVAVREIADGRLLVSDVGETRLSIVDFAHQSSTQLGRQGQGPAEYSGAGQLYPLPADSTLFVDTRGSRWLLLKGASFVDAVPGTDVVIRKGARNPLGASRDGTVLATAISRDFGEMRGTAEVGAADSSLVLRIQRGTGHVDTLGKLLARPSRITVTGKQTIQTVNITTNPLAVGEQAILFSDGWVAIARLAPYRVDWIDPQGRRVIGTPLPFVVTPLDLQEKTAALKAIQRDASAPLPDPATIADWPETLPPFLTNALLPAPDGRLWIRRTPTARRNEIVYDIVDRKGALSGRVLLAANQAIVGFGPRDVYLVTTDDDGIQHLQRRSTRK